jgi:uncharacterized membrane protein (UPF0127 family)
MHFLEPLLSTSANTAVLYVEGHETPLATAVETAFDSASRKKGLLGRSELADGTALVIAPCSAVHTFAMRFPIDVIFVGRDGRILKLRRALKTSRMAGALRAFAVVELAAGAIDRAGVSVGDRLFVRSR